MLPWLVFSIGFLLTTAIGAMIIGYSRGDRWGIDEDRQLQLQINLEPLDPGIFARPNYWNLLKVGVLVPLLGAVVAGVTASRRPGPAAIQPAAAKREHAAARLIFFAGVAWLVGRVLVSIPQALTVVRLAWTGGIETHYQMRGVVMHTLSSLDFGLAYSGLLCLLAFPLHRALVSRRNFGSMVELAFWYAGYALVAIILIQKLLISLSLLLAVLALLTAAGAFRHWKKLLLAGGLIFLVVHLAMSELLPDWSLTSSVDHIFGRTADSYPYALSLGVKHPFSFGQYFVGSVAGRPAFLGEAAAYNVDLFTQMYPKTEGATAIAAPVWSYCDVGWPGVWLTMLAVCALCALATWLSRQVDRSPMSWALFLLLNLQIYHLTQMPIVGILFWTYAVGYGIVALLAVALLSRSGRRLPAGASPSPAPVR